MHNRRARAVLTPRGKDCKKPRAFLRCDCARPRGSGWHANLICSRANPFPKDIRTRFATASRTRSSISSTAKAPKAGLDPWIIRAACETLATTNRVVIAGETRGPRDVTEGLDRAHRAHGHSRYRLRAGRLPLGDGGHQGAAAPAVCRHRPGRRCQAADQPGRGRGRPGHHVRLCLPRDAGADAGADLLQPQDPRGPRQARARAKRAKRQSSVRMRRARSRFATRTASRSA